MLGAAPFRLRRGVAIALFVMLAACGTTTPTSPPATLTPTGPPSPSTSSSPASPPGSPAATNSDPAVAPIRWTDCGNGFECGDYRVPLDYANPSGTMLVIAAIRLRATDQAHRIGSLVVNPGGPGASGVDFVRDGAESIFSKEIRAHFDIVGFDPRGVGSSSEFRCVDDLDHFLAIDETPDTPAELDDLIAGERTFVEGCERRNAAILPFLGTDNVAQDLDRLRAALGDRKLTYLGFSYGTLIGSLYAARYPDHIRALVLDGAIDPRLDLPHLNEGQAVAFEGAFDRFLAECASNPSCAFRHGGKPGLAFDALMRRIEAHPIPAKEYNGDRTVGPTLAWTAVAGAMYNRVSWVFLAIALAQAEHGDGSFLLDLSDPLNGRDRDGGYSNLIDANRGVTCLDFPAPRDPRAFERFATDWSRVAPRFGPLLAYNGIDCAFWPVPATRTPGPVSAPGAPPIVVVGTTGDPATPYAWAKALSEQLTSSVLITRRGEGHTGYGASTCVENAVDTYLLVLTPPRRGLTCGGT